MNELELISSLNSLYSQRKQLKSMQTSSNQEDVEKQFEEINKNINLCMSELEKYSNNVLPSEINIEFG